MTMTDKDIAQAKEQARAQLDSIMAMVKRLKHCQECDGEDCELVTEEDRANYHDEDDARQAIAEDPLSVEVRSDWHEPGDEEDSKPTEYSILLCTGGPAVKIIGDLDDMQCPDTAKLECQSWFTPWVRYRNTTEAEDQDLLTYARQFYFRE